MIEKKVLYLSDVHIPGHDVASTNKVIRAAKDIGVTNVVFGGDMLDFPELSRFTAEKPQYDRQAILDANVTAGYLDLWRDVFPKASMDWIDGNHEWRLEKYVREKAPKADGWVRSIPETLGFRKLKIRYHGHYGKVQIGRLTYIHGDNFPTGYGAVNPAKNLFDRARESMVFGHFHRFSTYRHRSFNGREHGAWGNGCLQGSAAYCPNDNWNRGALIVVYSHGGYFRVLPLEVIDGQLTYPKIWAEA